MSNSLYAYPDLFQELKKREYQYSSIEISGLIQCEDDIWKNVITKIHPKSTFEADKIRTSCKTYNYGHTIIFFRILSFEEAINVLNRVREGGKVSLQELPEYIAPREFQRQAIGHYDFIGSFQQYGGLYLNGQACFISLRME